MVPSPAAAQGDEPNVHGKVPSPAAAAALGDDDRTYTRKCQHKNTLPCWPVELKAFEDYHRSTSHLGFYSTAYPDSGARFLPQHGIPTSGCVKEPPAFGIGEPALRGDSFGTL